MAALTEKTVHWLEGRPGRDKGKVASELDRPNPGSKRFRIACVKGPKDPKKVVPR